MSDFNMRKQPWFIKIPSSPADRRAVREFIENAMGRCPTPCSSSIYFTNYVEGCVSAPSEGVMVGCDVKLKVPETEITFRFKSTVDVTTYPAKLAVETETQRQIRELDLVIREASVKLAALKNTQGVK